MPHNQAAYLEAPNTALVVRDAPYTSPKAGEVVVRNQAVAVNPVDWFLPIMGKNLFPWINFPFINGSDLSGEVVDIGEGVTRFKKGDRVVSFAGPCLPSSEGIHEGAFQKFTVVKDDLTALIPNHVSYTDAAVLPLALLTASAALYQDDMNALELPSINPARRNKWVIIWGASSSVGMNAVQLAVASGYDVIATASPKNFELIKSLGASYVLDYHNYDTTSKIIGLLKDQELAGSLAAATTSVSPLVDIVGSVKGSKFIADVNPGPSLDVYKGAGENMPAIPFSVTYLHYFYNWVLSWKTWWYGTRHSFFDSGATATNGIGSKIFKDFLGPALANGIFKPSPPARVVGHGLEELQKAFHAQQNGVSGEKIVITL